MKKIFLLSLIILAVLLILPLSAIKTSPNQTLSNSVVETAAPIKTKSAENFKVLISATNTITELSAKDYLFGVLAAEMPVLYEEEALKAQAVCAYTFALKRKADNKDNDYDITDDFKTDQAFISKESAIEKWGEKAEEYAAKLEKVINETENLKLTYKGEIILAVYHAISYGTTESAKNIWGKDYPYLQAVSSTGDKLSPKYITTAEFDPESIKQILQSETPTCAFTDFVRSEQGTVLSVKLNGKEYTGSKIRELFNLKSANFTAEQTDGKLIFTVYGYGHAVGLSQNGANYMAQQGSNFKEILTHYYKDVKIE